MCGVDHGPMVEIFYSIIAPDLAPPSSVPAPFLKTVFPSFFHRLLFSYGASSDTSTHPFAFPVFASFFHRLFFFLAQFGHIVLTTTFGIMDHEEARRKHTGGKILGFFY